MTPTTYLGGRTLWELQRWLLPVSPVTLAVFYRHEGGRAFPAVHIIGDWTEVLGVLWPSGVHWLEVLPRLQRLRARLDLPALILLAHTPGALQTLEARL